MSVFVTVSKKNVRQRGLGSHRPNGTRPGLIYFMEPYFDKKNVRFYIACGNLMVNVDQQHYLQRLSQNKTSIIRRAMTIWRRYVIIIDVEKHSIFLYLFVHSLV